MEIRQATQADVELLAQLNRMLIEDEGHRNPMTVPELERRMAGWLQNEYEAYLFEDQEQPAGYALYRPETDSIYLRQFFVGRERRRQGIGRAAFEWLRANPWQQAKRIRIEVLVQNAPAIQFWRAVGFADYALTMEFESNIVAEEFEG